MLKILALTKERFGRVYRQMLERLQQTGLPLGVCSIYDRCPFSGERMGVLAFVGLAVFNDEILQLASVEGLAVVDLRVICTKREDYSFLYPRLDRGGMTMFLSASSTGSISHIRWLDQTNGTLTLEVTSSHEFHLAHNPISPG